MTLMLKPSRYRGMKKGSVDKGRSGRPVVQRKKGQEAYSTMMTLCLCFGCIACRRLDWFLIPGRNESGHWFGYTIQIPQRGR